MHQSVRPSPIFLALVAITTVGGVLAWLAAATVRPMAYVGVFIFVIAGWLVTLCLHEFAHAFTAWRFGDHDVEVRGYLTLNPLKYSHPLLSLGLPVLFIALGGIGLPGGAVYVRTSFMTKRQKTLVSLAGPFANIVFAVLLLLLTRLLYDPAHGVFWAGMAFLGFLQVTAVVLNLLPIPPLDGYSALEPHLSPADPACPRTRQAIRHFHSADPADRTATQPVVLLGRGLVLRPVGRPHRVVADRQPADPLLVCLVLTRLAIYASLRIDCRTWVPATITAMPMPVSAGCSSPRRS